MTNLEWFHLVHALAITLGAGLSALVFRERLRVKKNRYLLDWLAACSVWIVYYGVKSQGLDAVRNGAETTGFRPAAGLFVELFLNSLNTAFIFLAAYSLSFVRQVRLWVRLRDLLILSICLLGLQVVFLVITQTAGLSLTECEQIGTVTASFMGGGVLTLLYHRLTRQPHVSQGLAAIVLWVFFSYAYLQAWYPHIALYSEPGEILVWSVFIAAAVLKIAATVVVFLAAEGPPPGLTRPRWARRPELLEGAENH